MKTDLPKFVSTQVVDARRFFLDLDPATDVDLVAVCAGVETMRPEYLVDRTDFPYFAIELVASGEGYLAINGEVHTLLPGAIFAYGPRFPHRIRTHPAGGMVKYYLDFAGYSAFDLLLDAGLAQNPEKYCLLTVGAYHELVEIFELFLREANDPAQSKHRIFALIVELLLRKVAQLSLDVEQKFLKSHATFEEIRTYIDRNFLSLRSIHDVASACHVTSVYVSRLFKKFSEVGAYEYLLRQRMNHAAGMLVRDGVLVKEVAHEMGYADPFHFSKTFKKVYGVSPSRLTERLGS